MHGRSRLVVFKVPCNPLSLRAAIYLTISKPSLLITSATSLIDLLLRVCYCLKMLWTSIDQLRDHYITRHHLKENVRDDSHQQRRASMQNGCHILYNSKFKCCSKASISNRYALKIQHARNGRDELGARQVYPKSQPQLLLQISSLLQREKGVR